MRYAFLFLCFTVSQLHAQNTAAKIAAINAQAAKTDSALHTYYTKVIDNAYFTQTTDNGREATGYFNVRTLEKITERVGLSSCWRTYTYYLKDGKPALIRITADDWVYDEKQESFRTDSITRVMDYTYYFEDYKLLQFSGTGASRCSGKMSKTDADDLLLQCKQLVYLLKQ